MNPLRLIEDPLRWLLDRLHEQGNLTYGWAIVVLTIIVRLALVPLAVRQLKSMRRMQAVGPQIKALQQKHAGDKRKQQEELMAFYKENDINPFSSCLPILFQAPIFIALFYVLRNFSRTGGDGTDPSFMGLIPNIADNITSIGWGAVPLMLIYGLSQLLSFEVSATPQTPNIQRWLMRLAPIGIVGFLFISNFPAGLLLYWMTTNLWTCGQQLILKEHMRPADAVIPAAPTSRSSRTPARQSKALAAPSAVDQDVSEPSLASNGTSDEPVRTTSVSRSPGRPTEGGRPTAKRRPRSASGGSPAPKRRPRKKGGA